MADITNFFSPDSIAVVGASNNPEKPGFTLFKNISESFEGKVYAVNPNQDEVLGEECYESILDVPGHVDLASILIPAPLVSNVIEQCIEKGVKCVYVGSEGFADAGERGSELQAEIVELAQDGDIRLWGPNCGGYLSSEPSLSNNYLLDTEGHDERHLRGNVSLIGQTGMIVGGLYLEIITENLLEISKALTIGNRADVAEPDLLNYLRHDSNTDVIGIYQESVRNGRDLESELAKTTPEKPVVMLKGGRSQAGAVAASSHTGSIAGDDRVADAVFRQRGVCRVHDFRELINLTKGFSLHPHGMEGNKVAILTMTGAGSVVASDLFSDNSLSLAKLSPESCQSLAELYPDWKDPENPVDIWLGIGEHGLDRAFCRSLDILLADEGVDGILVQSLAFDYFHNFDFESFVEIASNSEKPVVTWLVGEKAHTPYWKENLENGGIPVYRDLSTCARFLGAAYDYGKWKRKTGTDREKISQLKKRQKSAVRDRLNDFEARAGLTLNEVESKSVLESVGIPITNDTVVRTAEDAVRAAEDIGYPIVLKGLSQEIQHISDAGGVRLGLTNAMEVKEAYRSVTAHLSEELVEDFGDTVLVSEMLPEAIEVIVGVTTDPEFGPILLFGLGGTLVEVLDDIAIRSLPISVREAEEMVREIEGHKILKGFRGESPTDINAITNVLATLSKLAMTFEDEIQELDINPLMIFPEGKGVVAADALIKLDNQAQ